MNDTNKLGLDNTECKQIAEHLNVLLANYMVFYQNTRGLHWNIKGKQFFELHLKFEELYTDLLIKIDEIAERILTLEQIPFHTFEDYSTNAQIKIVKNVSDSKEGVQSIVDSFKIIVANQRELLQLSADSNDEGTNALMSDYIREQEKLIWMYKSFLDNE